jgi:iron(II)-dependent oxidoreductase
MLTTTNDLKDKHFRLTAAALAAQVDDAHECTLGLIADLDDGQFTVPLLEIVNPFLWELGHVAFFYDVFLLHLLDGAPLVMEGSGTLYDSFQVAHDNRWSLPLPSRQATLDYKNRVREGVLARLDKGREPDAKETYLHLLALMHEDMHVEAFTYMRQTLEYPAPRPGASADPPPQPEGGPLPGDVEIPGGTFRLGSLPEYPFVFDNEKWAHELRLKPFRIARAPVTNGEFAEFIEAGGYRRDALWSYEGLLWRTRSGARHPVYWQRGADGGWLRRHFDRLAPIEEHAPVVHVTWYEAEAYCAWAGRRLPSEAEWEMAAAAEADASGGIAIAKRRYPWGDAPPGPELANLDARHGGCVDVGAFAAGDSAFGCRQMIGNVWEWTASPFYPFPGYVVDFPYKEYSAPWFGYRKVLKGGAWATRPRFASNTRRNYFLPHRNDAYAGFRTCAREG